jgi:DNA-directed RNA polymerase subunit H (RpoH/RPB5)
MEPLYKENIYSQVVKTIVKDFLPCRKLELIHTDIITNKIEQLYKTLEELEESEELGVISDTEISSMYSELAEFNDIILNIIKNNGYIQIDANSVTPRGGRCIVSILILLNDDGKDKISNIQKIIESICKNNTVLDELIIIADKINFLKKNFKELILFYKKKEIIDDYNGIGAIYNAYPSIYFEFNVTKHSSVNYHSIMTKENIKKELDSEYINILQLPIIFEYDPNIVWIGARSGNVVQINRLYGSSISIHYKRVVYDIYTPVL